jgi:hypothetical protein
MRFRAPLHADDMEGRRAFTSGIDKASNFIESEFKRSKPFNAEPQTIWYFFMTESQRNQQP